MRYGRSFRHRNDTCAVYGYFMQDTLFRGELIRKMLLHTLNYGALSRRSVMVTEIRSFVCTFCSYPTSVHYSSTDICAEFFIIIVINSVQYGEYFCYTGCPTF